MNVQRPINQEISISWWTVMRGLLWREWMKQRNAHLFFLAFLVFCIFFQLIYFPIMVMFLGILYGHGAGLAAAESGELEEFIHSLPPSRKLVFLVRFLVGLIPFLLLGAIWIGVMESNLSSIVRGFLGIPKRYSFQSPPDDRGMFPFYLFLSNCYFCLFYTYNLARNQYGTYGVLSFFVVVSAFVMTCHIAILQMNEKLFQFFSVVFICYIILIFTTVAVGYVLFVGKEIGDDSSS